MSYAAQVIIPPGAEKRAARRCEVQFRGFVRETSDVFTVEVTDVSADGCRFRSSEPFETATNIWLKISGLTAREARIVWHEADSYGCEFLKPMQPALLDDLCAAHKREVAAAVAA